MPTVTQREIAQGLQDLGLDASSAVIVDSSLRSFGHVEHGAAAVCAALTETCGIVLMPASSWDCAGIPAPPGLERLHNAPLRAGSWPEFDAALANAVPFAVDLPIDRELGIIPETMRRAYAPLRSGHPLFS